MGYAAHPIRVVGSITDFVESVANMSLIKTYNAERELLRKCIKTTAPTVILKLICHIRSTMFHLLQPLVRLAKSYYFTLVASKLLMGR